MIARLARLVALGAILATCSELWFWQVNDSLGPLILVYGWAGAAMVALLDRFPGRGWSGVILAAAVFGFLIEGVMVPVLYQTLPFSILWTSLAWHALLSVGLGVVGFRALMRQASLWQVCLVLPLAGFLTGLWQGYLWTEDAPLPASGTTHFLIQSGMAAVLFLGGHHLLDLAASGSGRTTRVETAALFALPALLWAITWLLPLFPASLVLPVLLALTAFALWRGPPNRGDPLALTLATPLPSRRYPLFVLFLVAAAGGFLLAQGKGWEVNVVTVLIAGPVSVGLWLAALWISLRPRGVA